MEKISRIWIDDANNIQWYYFIQDSPKVSSNMPFFCFWPFAFNPILTLRPWHHFHWLWDGIRYFLLYITFVNYSVSYFVSRFCPQDTGTQACLLLLRLLFFLTWSESSQVPSFDLVTFGCCNPVCLSHTLCITVLPFTVRDCFFFVRLTSSLE